MLSLQVENESLIKTRGMGLCFEDPVTFDLMVDATILACGHSFSATTVQNLLRIRKKCPMCDIVINEDAARPNYSLREAIVKYKQIRKSIKIERCIKENNEATRANEKSLVRSVSTLSISTNNTTTENKEDSKEPQFQRNTFAQNEFQQFKRQRNKQAQDMDKLSTDKEQDSIKRTFRITTIPTRSEKYTEEKESDLDSSIEVPTEGHLIATVISGTNLSTTKPVFCELLFGKLKQKTKPSKRSHWNETFLFNVENFEKAPVMVIRVWKKGLITNRFVGKITVPFSQIWIQGSKASKQYKLQPNNKKKECKLKLRLHFTSKVR